MTQKESAPLDRSALKNLRDRIVLTLTFMNDVEDLGQIGQGLIATAESAFQKGDLRAMRLLSREIDSFTVALPSHQREGLEALVKARLGVDKDAERLELSGRVAAVLRRGTIASEKERQKLEAYVEARSNWR